MLNKKHLIPILICFLFFVELARRNASSFFKDYDFEYANVITLKQNFDSHDPKFSFASSYQSNMVLQMEPYSAVLWGFGSIGATVSVSLNEVTYHTHVISYTKDIGVWKVTLPAQPAGGPHIITAIHENDKVVSKLQLTNVLFGDVWICSGQSNMKFTVSMGFNASEEYEKASMYQDIRLMTPAEVESKTPLIDFQSIQQAWSVPSKESLSGPKLYTYFSATCWYYGKYIYDQLKVPIGLISPSWPGSPIECWSSSDALKGCGLEKQTVYHYHNNILGPNINSLLWNAMIHPLLKTTIKGVVWYQGEENSRCHTSEYSCTFPSMIQDWRRAWFEGTERQTNPQFPFGFVQISTRPGPDTGDFSLIRWHQTADYGYVPNPKMPNTFMAVAMDLGDPDSPFGEIHPRDKQDVGARLGLGAMKVAYGRLVNPNGPYPVKAKATQDGHVIVTYPNDQLLVVREKTNFQVCCSYSNCSISDPTPSSEWLWAPITSSSDHSITVQAKVCLSNSGQPAFVRYAWQLVPCKFKSCSVYNDVGLPGPPFVMKVDSL